MTDQPTTSLTPEIVSAILRDPDSPYYPSQIGVFCDGCGSTVTGDYLVRDDMTKGERLGVARSHLHSNAGWSCDAFGDFCPNCVTTPEEVTP